MYRLGHLNPIFYALLSATLFLVSCTSTDPEGKFSGEIKDWVYEVFEGNLMAGKSMFGGVIPFPEKCRYDCRIEFYSSYNETSN